MTKTLLASAALIFALSATSFAATPSVDSAKGASVKTELNILEAKRRKPRVPGGSGCDSPRDIAEHPECRRAEGTTVEGLKLIQEAKRRKPRVPGGSGCDTPADVAQHPECRA
jgi:hypothetical protein